MDRAELIEMFRKTAGEVAEKDFAQLNEDSVISSLGIDSLGMLEIIGEMERELQIHIPDDKLVGIETVKQLIDVVGSRMQEEK